MVFGYVDRTESWEIADNLDSAMNRWRNIYRSARTLLSRATQPIESGLLTVGSDEYKKHKRHQDQANRQFNLLRNDIGSSGRHRTFRVLSLPLPRFRRFPARLQFHAITPPRLRARR